MICSFQMGGGGGGLQTKEERMDEKGAYDRVKGEMNGKMKHKGVVADEQTKLHEVKVEIM